MAERRGIIFGSLAVLALAATLAGLDWSGLLVVTGPDDASVHASAGKPTDGSFLSGDGGDRVDVPPRDVDSAALVTTWTSPNADLEQVRAAADQGIEPLDLVFADYAANADLAHFATGNADDTERGEALARCYAGASSLGQECDWNQRLIIRRTGDRRGEVVHVAQAYDRDKAEPNCKRMIACVNEAWRGAEASLPADANDYTTLEFAGVPCTLPTGLDEMAWEDALEARESLAREAIESMAECDRQACLYNSRDAQACLVHIRKLREHR